MENVQDQAKENFYGLNVYDRIQVYANEEALIIDDEAREKLQDMLLDHYAQRVTKVSDEILIQIAKDERVIL